MRDTRFDSRSSEWLGDMTVWLRENAADNSEQLDRLRRNLRLARERELTARQRQMLTLYYDHGMSIPQIALKLGLNRSTVSRTIRRAKERLYHCLQYTL
ncbi:sigma-70 family RNA polymerase sigma factor [uncultured Dysosmobacter sp.]|uniref:sigma-70 family RNA polymerase sigma factor n=1 Tax=uncultured Dysosmobacter sp. TaxID=2591384 RepID=UPI002622483A|nr:sigma-70 family RNA polymerase sigma factor [uncultured Dysosmobacter sp.]